MSCVCTDGRLARFSYVFLVDKFDPSAKELSWTVGGRQLGRLRL